MIYKRHKNDIVRKKEKNEEVFLLLKWCKDIMIYKRHKNGIVRKKEKNEEVFLLLKWSKYTKCKIL